MGHGPGALLIPNLLLPEVSGKGGSERIVGFTRRRLSLLQLSLQRQFYGPQQRFTH